MDRVSGFRPLVVAAFVVSLMVVPPVLADSGIQPSIDMAQFKDSQNNSYMEIYYSIPEVGMNYMPDGSGKFACQLVLDIEIHRDSQLWANKVWKIEKTVADTSSVAAGSQMVDVVRYLVEQSGEYRISMRIKDMHHTDRVDSARAVFQVSPFTGEAVEISDVELASHIKKMAPGSQSNLIKNTYKVTPNPAGIFGEGAASIYYYFEAYNLKTHLEGDHYKSVCKVIDSNGVEREGLGITYRPKKKLYNTSIEIGMLNISNLPSGKYRLLYGIADESKTMIASKEKMFYVYNPNVFAAEVLQEGRFGPLEELSEAELDDEFAKLIHINTKDDREFYGSLNNVQGKREFIFSIWSRANDNRLPPLVYREQYLGRAHYANDKFKSIFAKGWKSDRGRVFILYGGPSDIERFASTETTVPYQVWTYDKLKGQGGVQFVFADKGGFSKYELLHSDLRGERRNDSWKTEVFRGSNERQFRN